jgi:hypothetical protein
MQSEQVEVRAPLPTLASLDDEFGAKQAVSESAYPQNRLRRLHVWLVLATALSGVTLAVAWSNNALQLRSLAQSFPSLVGEQTENRSSAGSAQPLVELEALKKEISELRDWQQQVSAEITGLLTAQEELQRSSVKAISWYSESNALLHQQAAPTPRTAAVRTQGPITQVGATK